MFLDTWMLVLGVGMYGVCAWYSYNKGYKDGVYLSFWEGHTAGFRVGSLSVFKLLQNKNVIVVTDDVISPGSGTLRQDDEIFTKNEKTA
jgi:hypothetical protein